MPIVLKFLFWPIVLVLCMAYLSHVVMSHLEAIIAALPLP